MSFETGVFPGFSSEDEAAESNTSAGQGGLTCCLLRPLHVQLSDLMQNSVRRLEGKRIFRLRPNSWRSMSQPRHYQKV